MNFHLSNKPGINTAVMQSTHPQQQRKMTMKKVVSTLMLSTAIVTSSIALPTHAAVIDTVKDKVIAIKKDTGSIKSQTSGIKTRVEEIRSSVNANIAESIDIRSLVEPLDLVHKMKDKFGGGGFDPAELLESVAPEELTEKLEEMKQNREEMQQMVSGPGLEEFRQEFIDTLQGVTLIVSGDGPLEITPLQTLIEKAPLPLIAALKAGSETSFGPLRESIMLGVESLAEMREINLLDVSTSSKTISEPTYLPASYGGTEHVAWSGVTTMEEQICSAIDRVGIDRVHSVLTKFQSRLIKIKKTKHSFYKKVKKQLKKIPKLPDVGIHGYLTIPLSKIDLAQIYISAHKNIVGDVDIALAQNDLRIRNVEWKNQRPQSCGILPVLNQHHAPKGSYLAVNHSP